jgi:catechol 2,3-dioxygenase-like lactoylglutathione lyase family enzyme
MCKNWWVDLNHLNLRVADPGRARAFYEEWFGFREKFSGDGAVFLTNDERFLLALFPAEASTALPAGYHFGFNLDNPEEVRSMHQAMTARGVRPGDLEDWDDYVTFRCQDLDGHEVEVFWEP